MNTEFALKLFSMLEACAIWALIYILSYVFTIVFGLKRNILRQTDENIKRLLSILDSVDKLLEPDNRNSENFYKRLRKMVRMLVKRKSETLKIIKIFIFDNPNIMEAQVFVDEIKSTDTSCIKLIECLHNKEYDGMSEISGEIRKAVISAQTSLSNLHREEERKIKKI